MAHYDQLRSSPTTVNYGHHPLRSTTVITHYGQLRSSPTTVNYGHHPLLSTTVITHYGQLRSSPITVNYVRDRKLWPIGLRESEEKRLSSTYVMSLLIVAFYDQQGIQW